jgi:hypothetical protein
VFQKKSKTYHFHDEWEIEYFSIMVKDKYFSLICNASLFFPKKGNLESHYNALHSNKYDADFPPKSEIPQLKLKSELVAQQQLTAHFISMQPYHP